MKNFLKSVALLAALSSLFAGSAMAQDKPAPEKFRVKFETTKGDVVIDVTRAWAPVGADHFYASVAAGFYDECRFFRVVPGFMVQFGINGDPKLQSKWGDITLKDDPVKESNRRGFVTYAKTGRPNSRSTQLFINFGDNAGLDRQGFAPFGKVSEGLEVVDKINAEYGEKPDQGAIKSDGNAYLKSQFPRLDFIKKATILGDKK